MIAVPDYLEPYARNENRGGEYLSFDIRCSCGCDGCCSGCQKCKKCIEIKE